MKLIDADSLKKWVEEYHTSNWGIPQDELIYAIGSAQTIDPVKHGKWMEKKVTHEANRVSTIIADWQSAKCSNCGKYHTTPYLYYFHNYNYCPNCGAKMDGGEG